MFAILRTQRGFSLVELLTVMVIFTVLIVAIGTAFQRILPVALKSTKTAETNISGIVGLELLRADLESAGYGLPWSFSDAIVYNEAAQLPGSALNDNGRVYTDPTQNNIPRPIATLNEYTGAALGIFPNTDVLTVRSLSVAANATSRKWTYMESGALDSRTWSEENLEPSDRVIAIQPIKNFEQSRELVVNAGTWTSTFASYKSAIGTPTTYSVAEGKSDAYIIYGVDGGTPLSMPFNRADFFVRPPNEARNLPQRCNPQSGILYKNIVTQDGGAYTSLPLFECVLDMQVVFDLLVPGTAATIRADSLDGLSPQNIRDRVKAVRVFILAHEGGPDKDYSYPTTDSTGDTGTIVVGPGPGTGKIYNFNKTVNPNWRKYRWRVYQIVARPSNLTGNITR